jgi:TPR repeat protein
MKSLVILAAAIALASPFAASADPTPATRAYLAGSDGEWQEALRLFVVAAEDGDVTAKETVAWMYLNGAALFPGVERDVPLAKTWYQRAEAQGSAAATRMLAQIDRAPIGAVAAAPEARPAR